MVTTEVFRRARALNEARIMLARTGLATFVEQCVKDDHGERLVLAPMHLAWLRHIDYCWANGYRAMILAPFGSGKSSCLAVPLLAHSIGRDRNVRIKIVTNDDDSASKRLGAVRKIVESAVYRRVFPEVKIGGAWTGHELYVERLGHSIDPTVHARGVLTTGIGGRCDLMLFDDVVDQKNSMDQSQRRRVLSLIEQTWLSRLEPDGRALMIGTCWHQDDAMHHLMQKPRWCTLKQAVTEDCTEIAQEVIGGGADYPGARVGA
jgi:hypothetical protein